MTLWRVEAPHFVAGIEVDDEGRVHRAAPILRWTVGRLWFEVKAVMWQKYHWQLTKMDEGTNCVEPFEKRAPKIKSHVCRGHHKN